MKKGRIAAALSLVIALLTGCSAGNAGTAGSKREIRVWTTDGTRVVTQTKLNEWLSEQSEWKDKYTITVSAMGTGEVVTQFLTDIEESADVFSFAQDQLSRLIAVDAVSAPGGKFLDGILAGNDEGSIQAATQDGKVYAYPETSDNGYLMYYDKSVVTDTSTLEGILDQCAAAGKKFYYPLNNGWYNMSFFFATGTDCKYTCSNDGIFTDASCDFDSEAGMKAFKTMISMSRHPGYALSSGTDAAFFSPDGGTAGAVVSVPSEAATAKRILGENYGAAPLPTFTTDGESFHMSGFKGYKLIGVKPHSDSDTTVFCHLIAEYLSGEEMQLARYAADGWGPSNLKAQQSDVIKSDIALKALNEQFAYCREQEQFPNEFWSIAQAFGEDINAGKYNDAGEPELKAALADFEDTLLAAR